MSIEDLRRSTMPQCEQSDCGLKRKCKRYAKKADTIPLVSGRYPKAKIGDMIITTAKPSECGFFIKK